MVVHLPEGVDHRRGSRVEERVLEPDQLRGSARGTAGAPAAACERPETYAARARHDPRRAMAALVLLAMGLGGCAWLMRATTAVSGHESTACGVTPGGQQWKNWFYPPGQREACRRVLGALAELRAQRQRGELCELTFLERAVALLNGPDATAVLAASTASNGGWLGERKHAYEQALEAAGRSATGK